jgi:DNA-binding transcriptional ArsR family regulator
MDGAAAPVEPPSGDAAEGTLEPAPYGALPVGSKRRVWARRTADEAEAKALASPLRLRILRVTLHEPHTNKEIAEALGLNPASVLHHVRTLVDTGFLIEQPARRGPRGSRERPYLASGKSFYVSMGHDRQDDGQDLLLTTFLQEVEALPPGALDSTRLGFRLAPHDLADVRRRIADLLDEIAAMPSDPSGEAWSLYLGLHPDTSGVPSSHDEHPDGHPDE